MLRLLVLWLLFRFALLGKVEIQSPRRTNWGDWNGWRRCSDGTFANRMQVKIESEQGGGRNDDTALNSIVLYCSENGEGGYGSQELNPGESPWGYWREKKNCPVGTLIVGFELLSENEQGNGDDTAAVNFAAYCGTAFGPRNGDIRLESHSQGWGSWTGNQFCPIGYAVCGIQTQIEQPLGKGDDTALNNVNLECCEVKIQCTPRYSLVKVDEYDNRKGSGTIQYSYTRKVSYSSSTQSSRSFGHEERNVISKKLSSSHGVSLEGVTSQINHELAQSNERITTSQLQWMIQDSITNERSETVTFNIPAWSRLIIEQLFVTCGEHKMRLAKTITRSY